MGPLLLVVLTLLVACLAVPPGQAALDSADHSLTHGFWIGLLLVLGALCLTVITLRGRKAAVLGLALLLALFGLESAIHSVHHLSDPQAAASCAMFSASQHVPAACAETVQAGAPTWRAEPAPTADAGSIRPLQTFRPHEGRAPPAAPPSRAS